LTLVHHVLVTGFKQPLQTNVFITLYMLPFCCFWYSFHISSEEFIWKEHLQNSPFYV